MNEFCLPLAFPENVLKSSISIYSLPRVRRTVLSDNCLNPSVIKILNQAQLSVGMIEVFFAPPDFVSVIHRDTPNTDIAKINWVYGGRGSKMYWYETPANKIIEGNGNNRYTWYTPEESQEIFSTAIAAPSLVQAAVAHNVKNANEDRWAVSLLLVGRNSKSQIAFKDAATKLADYIT